MSDLRDLYQDVILEHSKAPRNYREQPAADHKAEGFNPLCGDHFTIFVKLDGDKIQDISFQGSGCAISKASASMMTQSLKGKTKAEAEQLFTRFHDLVTGHAEGAAGAAELGKLEGFLRRVRVPCPREVRHARLAHAERRARRQAGSHNGVAKRSMNYGQSITLSRECDALEIPSGEPMKLPAGTGVRVMQFAGSSYTITSDHGMSRIDVKDADALGLTPPPNASQAGERRNNRPFSEELVWEQLKTVYDPEIPVNIADLGLIYVCTAVPVQGGRPSHRHQNVDDGPGLRHGQRPQIRRRNQTCAPARCKRSPRRNRLRSPVGPGPHVRGRPPPARFRYLKII